MTRSLEHPQLELAELIAAIPPHLESGGNYGLGEVEASLSLPTSPALFITADALIPPDTNEDASLAAFNGDDYFSRLAAAASAGDSDALQVLKELASRSPGAVEQLRKLVLRHGLEVRGPIEPLLIADDDFFLNLLSSRVDIAAELGDKLLQFITQVSFPNRWLRRNGFKAENVALRYVDFLDANILSLKDVAAALLAEASIAGDLATFVSEKQRAVWTWRTPEFPNAVYERKLLLTRELLRVLRVEPFREWPTDVVDWPSEAFSAPLWPLPEGDIEFKLALIQERVDAYFGMS